MDTKIDFKDPAYYENRELSWIKFDQRVLSEARAVSYTHLTLPTNSLV